MPTTLLLAPPRIFRPSTGSERRKSFFPTPRIPHGILILIVEEFRPEKPDGLENLSEFFKNSTAVFSY
jgi:hypothetical protein